MKASQARDCFAALSQETRLAIVRMLVKAGSDGMAARAIADKAGVSPSNLTFHVKELENAGLITQRREGRSILYAAHYPTLGDLIGFLMKDCCAGHPEICAPIINAVSCKPASKRSRINA